MAFTSTDQSNIESAIVALARGQRVVRVRFDDGQEVTYHQTDLEKLEALLDRIKSDINISSGASRARYVMTSGGY